jgi:tetratricopeptide (TPR) repeat protein
LIGGDRDPGGAEIYPCAQQKRLRIAMKTERRHELQKNDLVEHLNRSMETVRPYSSLITVLVVVAAVVGLGYLIFSRQAAKNEAQAWNEYYQAQTGVEGFDAEKLQAVADEHPNSAARDWALLAIANQSLERGDQLLARDKPAATPHLEAAAEKYRALSKDARVAAVRERATFNLGIAYEALGEADKAIEAYGAVQGALAPVAAARVENLKQPEAREFYAWYAKAEPPTPFLPPHGMTPGERPAFDLGEPGDSILNLPSNIGAAPPAAGDAAAASSVPKSSQPAALPTPGAAPAANAGEGTPPEPAQE